MLGNDHNFVSNTVLALVRFYFIGFYESMKSIVSTQNDSLYSIKPCDHQHTDCCASFSVIYYAYTSGKSTREDNDRIVVYLRR